jgi:hypothetical protein
MVSKTQVKDPFMIASIPDARTLYHRLLRTPESADCRVHARRFLQEQLEHAGEQPHDLPASPQDLADWMERKTRETGSRYAEYLESRKQGAPRRYFSCRSHGLFFLQQAAPTKLVDGAWLYGVLPYWKDPRFQGLVRTYLEELGDGDPDQNHVVLYQRLLAENDCQASTRLTSHHYVRGAVQLAFAFNAEHFLPELIGYNLGYEQLPLHLLITAFELAELDIDPYYFTLHVTVDNAATGHARRAVQSVTDCMPVLGDSGTFWERVVNGYQLNDVGVGVLEIIQEFNLDREVERMLERKRPFGQHMHSDYCLIEGRTVNDWLSTPGQMPAFLRALEARGWVIRNQDPCHSRFWMLLDGPRAPMAGVFNGYEKQLIHDWIVGDAPVPASKPRRVFPRYRPAPASEPETTPRASHGDGMEERDHDEILLRRELLSLDGPRRMRRLIDFMSPSRHAAPVGLYATREFVAALNKGGTC